VLSLSLCEWLVSDLLCLVDLGHVARGFKRIAELLCCERLKVFPVVLMSLTIVNWVCWGKIRPVHQEGQEQRLGDMPRKGKAKKRKKARTKGRPQYVHQQI
jgi:hypothetical protein